MRILLFLLFFAFIKIITRLFTFLFLISALFCTITFLLHHSIYTFFHIHHSCLLFFIHHFDFSLFIFFIFIFLGVPRSNYESFQVLKYDIGQSYVAHHDYGGGWVGIGLDWIRIKWELASAYVSWSKILFFSFCFVF